MGQVREFHFQDGTSDKFWRITVDDKTYTVQFGRRGTAGQTQTKEFGSASEAKTAADKLIAEKVRKGYQEAATSGVAAIAAVAPKPKPVAEPSAPAAAPAPPPVAAPKQPAAITTTAGARTLGLAPEDWLFATWRPRNPVPMPQAPAFEADRLTAAVRRVKIGGYGWSADWSAVPFPPAMTATEAAYWLGVLAGMKKDVDVEGLGQQVLAARPGPPSLGAIRELIFNDGHRWFGPELMIAIRALLSTDEIVSMVIDAARPRHQIASSYIDGFRRFVLPYMTDAELASARDRLQAAVQPAKWGADLYHVPREFHLAALLGMHEPLRRTVESWPDNAYTATSGGWSDHYHAPQLIVFGLESAALVEHHWRRLQLPHKLPQHIRGWLAHTELSALDVVRDSVLANDNREQAEALVDVLTAVVAPEVGPTMLDLSSRSKAPKPARTWLEEHPVEAIAGLAPTAATRGALADAAIEVLRALSRRGHTPAVAEAIARLEPASEARVRSAVLEAAEDQLAELDDATTPAWLRTALATAPAGKKAKAAAWVGPEHLPALVVGDRRLAAGHVSSLLVALAASPLGEPQSLVKAIAEHVDDRYRHAFAWRLFERWRSEGAPPKEKWAMCALGHLGSDESVLALAPLVRAWPGESQHQRAVLGLEVLRAIGSDAALMQLNAIAQKLKFQGLKTRAKELMEQIAEQKGLTRAELEDRIVPDCDLDERGRRIFEFGPRKFELVFGPDMKPMVRDESGKVRPDLPAPGAKDDTERAEAEVAAWKLMKKQIREVAKIQAERLEQAMVTGRRWSPGDLETLIVRHPLMTHLARLLVWGAWDARGGLRETFRVTEDRECVNAEDTAVSLSADRKVGIVHPLHLSDDQRRTWGQVFADYAILPPFPQLGREIHSVPGSDASKRSLERFARVEVPAPSLIFTLEKLGWRRGTAMDGGCFDEHSRQFPTANITAVVTYEGTVSMGYIDPNEKLKITGCYFVEGLHGPSGYENYEKATTLTLGKVDPVVLSETMHDLETVAAKGPS